MSTSVIRPGVAGKQTPSGKTFVMLVAGLAVAIAEVNAMSELTIELFDVVAGGAIYEDFTNGFPYIVSSMKSLLETDEALPAPY